MNVAVVDTHGDLVNFSNIARDCGVSNHTVQSYVEILIDTLLGRWLPAYTKRPKRRVVAGTYVRKPPHIMRTRKCW